MADGKVIAAEDSAPPFFFPSSAEEESEHLHELPLLQLHFAVATEDFPEPQHSFALTVEETFNVFSLWQA